MATESSKIGPVPLAEWGALAVILAALGSASLWRLGEMIVPDMDEGVYVYAGKLIAEGSQPYRDFMLAHPPLVPYLAALSWEAGEGSLMFTRLVAILLTMASCVPVFLLARRLAGSGVAGLLAVCIYHVGMIWTAHLGRTLRLEPVQNAFLVAGFAAWILGRGNRSAFGAGLLLAGSLAAKFTSIVPIACLAIVDLLWQVGGKTSPGRRWVLASGAAAVLIPLGAWCLAQPGFVEWTLQAQAGRPRQSLQGRATTFLEALVRFPLLVPGLAYAAWQLRSPSPLWRAFAWTTLICTGSAVLMFNTFFRHYLAIALPWLSILLGAGVATVLRPAGRRPVVLASVALAVLSPILFTEISIRRAPLHSTGAASVIPFLKSGRGYLLTSAPTFALASGRTLLPWYFIVDSYLGRETGRLADAEFAAAVARAGTVVLYPGEAGRLPLTRAVLAERFRALPVSHWEAWEAVEPPR